MILPKRPDNTANSNSLRFATETKFRKSDTFRVDVLLGDPRLALIEDTLATDWNSGGVRGIRTTYMFRNFLLSNSDYDYVFFDMGPSLGSINRSVLIGCDYFVLPLSIDLFSIRATENISSWIKEWSKRLELQLNSISDKVCKSCSIFMTRSC